MIRDARAAAAHARGACIGTWRFRKREWGAAQGERVLYRGAVRLPGAVRLIVAGAYSEWLYPAHTKPANL